MDRRDRHGQEGPLSAAEELARFRPGDIGFLVVIGILASIAAGWLHARGSGSGGTLEVLRGFVIAGLGAGVFAAVAGAFMYFATLTEVPILQGLIGAGMGKGPALALLLAGPALSLPNMLVIRSVMGTKKTVVFVVLVVVMATATGMIYGAIFG